ncbi:glycoside hydrolase family 2 protein [Actinopolymorpha rutila]|uniref:Glycoside hydrolase family 2 immunoglobulin-like beta-sandwich domain-containing protein n=1 Tax=Actinopolymorpha rutila TaxID=446787 RepID=A0A852ZE39_9ACTN|nr:glycoside hydrolase [Actinopolymorpha rutila]NYH90108.1 hypothetical protein [Actinopolymorpha rutila]
MELARTHQRLSDGWQVRRVGTTDWHPVRVPGCWEDTGIAKDDPGPVDYRTSFVVPDLAPGERLWLRFGAVSYACTVYVDEQPVGEHVGMWDAFDVEVTTEVRAVRTGARCTLRVRAEKPASLTGGPDAPPVPGSYPTRETLAGFLPYVWGHVHGGIWQDVSLVVTGPVVFDDVHALGTPDGALSVQASLSGERPGGKVALTVTDPDGAVVAEDVLGADGSADGDATPAVRFDVRLPDPRPWSPEQPDLYTVRVRLLTDDGFGDAPSDERTVRAGLRTVSADGARLLLNGAPMYPRMILSWGWYPDVLYANPGPDRVRADLLELRRLGFNGVKLCLWFPPDYYFDLADELGMLVWVELPMWLPHPTEHFRGQLDTEAERLVRAARTHPSVVLYTLGCELSAVVGDDVLGPLYAKVKALVGDALVRDNSGSGEAYGGLLTEYADFYDHHLYCELQHFRETLEHFAPGWREPKPWLFGEFCDLDTFRDLRRIDAAGPRPWWTSDDPAVNPQGARWQYDSHLHEARLRANGFWDRGNQLEEISRKQALLHRKVTLETVRLRADTSGYVITGERDTPISTAGLWDDLGELKVDPEEFRGFNDNLVVGLGWDRRRTWLAGGDRPAYGDPWCHPEGASVRAHLVLAHHGREHATVTGEWSVAFEGEAPFAQGTYASAGVRSPGTVGELAVAEFTAPAVDRPRQAVLCNRTRVGRIGAGAEGTAEETANSWPLWFFPARPFDDAGLLTLADPGGRLADLPKPAPEVGTNVAALSPTAVVVATRWSGELDDHVRSGGRAVLLVDAATGGPFRTVSLPFWREAVKVPEPHPAWGDFPHQGWVSLQFAGCATDLALAWDVEVSPILRRVDARTAEVHDYAAEVRWGDGRLIVSTLRFEGSAGDQPRGLARNTGAAYLLSRWVRHLRSA